MMGAVLADSGPLYAAADESDAHHQRALEDLEKLARNRRVLCVAYPTLLESYSLVQFRLGTKAGLRWLSYMSDSVMVNPILEDYRQAFARLRELADQRITLFDTTVAALATRLGMQVWTYDHHFDLMRVPVWR